MMTRKNPSRKEDLEHLPPAGLAESILAREKQVAAIMEEIKGLLESVIASDSEAIP